MECNHPIEFREVLRVEDYMIVHCLLCAEDLEIMDEVDWNEEEILEITGINCIK